MTAVCFLSLAGGAQAALQLGNTSNNEAGELFVTMWNKDQQTSFIQDLNLYTSDLLYGTGVISDGLEIEISQHIGVSS